MRTTENFSNAYLNTFLSIKLKQQLLILFSNAYEATYTNLFYVKKLEISNIDIWLKHWLTECNQKILTAKK